jgi:AcrR family transcriptional regulator
LSVQRRRDELIDVALELYSRSPGHQVSIEDVADAAGASRALVYHYFGGKRGLQLAALATAADEFTAALAVPAGRQGESLRQQLDGLVGRYLDFVQGHTAGFAALQRSAATHRHDELGGHVHRVRQALFEWLLGAIGPAAPVHTVGPLRLTLWAWIGAAETATLDWLESAGGPAGADRSQLQRLLAGYLVVMLRTAGVEDAALARRLGPDF